MVTQWEYLVIEYGIYTTDASDLDKLGAQGWELTGVVNNASRSFSQLFFKHPKA